MTRVQLTPAPEMGRGWWAYELPDGKGFRKGKKADVERYLAKMFRRLDANRRNGPICWQAGCPNVATHERWCHVHRRRLS